MSLMNLLPSGPGYLPQWQLLIAVVAGLNSLSNFSNPATALKVYNATPSQVSALQSRTFAIWTLTSGMVRAFAAYNIHESAVYKMTFLTYTFAILHFASECFVFRTAKLSAGTISPFIVSSVSMYWMWTQYGFYVGL